MTGTVTDCAGTPSESSSLEFGCDLSGESHIAVPVQYNSFLWKKETLQICHERKITTGTKNLNF